MLPFPDKFILIAFMNVSVKHILGMPLLHKFVEAFKAKMRKVLHVSVPSGRRVRDKNIHTVHQKDLAVQLRDPPAHLCFRIHVLAQMIAHAAAKARDPKAFIIIHLVINMIAPERRIQVVFGIMIAAHIQERAVYH